MKTNLKYIAGFLTSLIVFLFFVHTLSFPSKHFDEQIIFNELIYPIPHSISELMEYLRYFGLHHYFEASNPFYSSISNIRLDPFNTLTLMIAFLVFQKSLFTYHLLGLVFHTLNSYLLFLILNNISRSFIRNENNNLRTIITALLTLIWALHPANVEAILLTTNWIALFSFSFCFAIILFYLKTVDQPTSVYTNIIVFLIYLLPLFIVEYSITIPAILFVYLLAYYMQKNLFTTFKKNLNHSINKIAPLIAALIIFVVSFVLFETKTNFSTITSSSIGLTLERVVWLASQVFVHYIKLIIFPINLSIDQTSRVIFSNQLYAPYAVGCIFVWLGVIATLIFTFIGIKKKPHYFVFIALCPFIMSLIPFLHILSPTYCIASERYLYFPGAMLIIGISHFIFYIQSTTANFSKWKFNLLFLIISCALIGYSTRAYVRTFDWKDGLSLHKSALKESGNGLFKGLRQSFIGGLLLQNTENKRAQINGRKYIKLSTYTLEKYLTKLEADKQKYQNKIPKIIKQYGLDPRTFQAKTAYLLTHARLALNGNISQGSDFLESYMKKVNLTDTQILDFYLGLLFATQKLDEAERILSIAIKEKLSPTILTITAELYKQKYNAYIKAETYLNQSFQLFPYDPQTLDALRKLYLKTNKLDKFAYFSYLYGIRTHSKYSLQDAYNVYVQLDNIEMAEKALKSLEVNK